jgi:PAS domain S-box-containing protein
MQVNRNLIAKNLDMLVISGQVEMQVVGAAKMYFLSQKVPLSSMLEFFPDLVIMINEDQKIVFVNEQVPALLGTTKDDLIGKRMDEIDNAFLRDLVKSVPEQDSKEAISKERVAEMTIPIKNESRYFRTKKIPTAFEDGSQGFTFIIEDITPQKKYQNMLEISEARYREIVMSSGEAIIGNAPDGMITSWNPAAERLFGYAEGEILRHPFNTLVHKDQQNSLSGLLNGIHHGTGIQRHEMTMMRHDGKTVDALITISPIKGENGIITGASSIVQDITLEKLGQHAREHEDRYRKLVEDLNVGVYRSTGDPRGRFVWGNTALIQILGYRSMEDLQGIDVIDVFSEPDGRKQMLEDLIKKGFVKNRILNLKRNNGEPVTVSVTALAEFNADKELVFINGIVQDITSFINNTTGRPGFPAGTG